MSAKSQSEVPCGCGTTSAQGSSAAKQAAYKALLSKWWPQGSPYPPALPWVGSAVTRDRLTQVIDQFSDQLPALKSGTDGDEDDLQNIAVLTNFIDDVLQGSPGLAPIQAMSCGNKGSGDDSTSPECTWDACNAWGIEVCADLGGVVRADFDSDSNKCLVLCGDRNDGETDWSHSIRCTG